MAAKTVQSKSARSRIHRLRLSFSGLHSDALLVTHLPNIRYLCGFTGSAAILLVEQSRATLYTDSRYTLQARQEVHDATTVIAPHGLLRALGEALKARRGAIRLAFAPAQLTVAQKDALQLAAGARLRWLAAPDLIERLRAAKDAEELALMRQSARLISDVWTDAVRNVKPGISELAVAADIERSMKLQGASAPSFETIVASGPRSAWPHARPTPKLLRKNELVVLDQGAILRDYCSDMTRTVFLGRSSVGARAGVRDTARNKVRSLYDAVLEAQEAAIAAIRPGVSAASVDAAARKVFKRLGLDRYFTHSTGHGLGLEIHEMPRLGRAEETLLESGMVVTVEPGVYIERMGGIRIEDEVLVTSRGAEFLTSAS
ncbi:MAG TPA: Xaa-Pro peptidase family protein, partial [Steroidobacteraceae bacterium]|nr:Xaa-Pro peptidase family protein [Steroidobacteraceae bacterium]